MSVTGSGFELPHPEQVWIHGALLAALRAGGGVSAFCSVDADGVFHDDGGGNWWRMTWIEGDRAVVVGTDSDYSDTLGIEPELDLLAGAPSWFPRAWVRDSDGMLGFAYWWDGRRWDRTPYPEEVEDGHRLVSGILDWFADNVDDPAEVATVMPDLITRAEAARVDEAALARVLDKLAPDGAGTDAAAALAAAELAGLTPARRRPELPSGAAGPRPAGETPESGSAGPRPGRETPESGSAGPRPGRETPELPSGATEAWPSGETPERPSGAADPRPAGETPDPAAWPDLADDIVLAATDPAGTRARVAGWAGAIAVADVPAYLDHACERFLDAGRPDEAAHFFALARKVEDAHEWLLGQGYAVERAHRSFLRFAPRGLLTPAAIQDRLKRLSLHTDAAAAHRMGWELAAVFLDAGSIPYPQLLDDLRPLAAAAGVAESDEEDRIAERFLRSGLLRAAGVPVWRMLSPALVRLCRASAEWTDLLVEVAPAPGGGGERDVWLDVLARGGAGKRLPAAWFFGLGATASRTLLTLADQAGGRLFAPRPGLSDVEVDPVVVEFRRRDPLAFRTRNENRLGPQPLGRNWHSVTDFDDVVARFDATTDVAEAVDQFVRTLNYYNNVDYPPVLRAAWGQPVIREVLDESVTGWLAEAGADDLLGLEIALPRLVPLAEAGIAALDPDRFADPVVTDPVDALLHALRWGIPEELRMPTAPGWVSVVQHRDHLTIAHRGGGMDAYHANGEVVHRDGTPESGQPWFDGTHWYVSRYSAGIRQTFRLGGNGGNGGSGVGLMSVDADTVTRWPEAPVAGAVTFPGADRAGLVRISAGQLWLSTPDGRITARLPFAPTQPAGAVLPPPGWWSRLEPTDPDGSAALRAITREAVTDLVDAALRGPTFLTEALTRILPAVTDPRLREGVESLARVAATTLTDVVRLRDALRLDRPAALPPLLRTGSGLRSGRATADVVTLRTITETLQTAAANDDGPRGMFPLGKVPVPDGGGVAMLRFGGLGSAAIEAAWPWTLETERGRLVDRILAWSATAWGDGRGRLRRLSYSPKTGQSQPVGELWRTPTGVMVIVSFHPHKSYGAEVVEYAPDGVFESFEFPGWTLKNAPVPQGWGGTDRAVAFARLLAERGPVIVEPAAVRELAARTGLTVAEVAAGCYGWPYSIDGSELVPRGILDLFVDPATGERAARGYKAERWLRPLLMPDDPEDLWTVGLDVDRVAAEWREP
ncbi:hypothetical protein [Virgisporangium aurantiacum]|uniref:Uncharacterized protein n=1 Tax=Virgisporangium aurantiacum TaxID=175570 RepID=A0A8J3ZGB0_9ACTN|nr:hypothetical protein [Virgisporangium aurantiacum]GIJ61071.1 hypothetical protein Vau01_085870 [Virgisporangium aurantiacum]